MALVKRTDETAWPALSHDEPGRSDHRPRFRVVVIVNHRWRGLRRNPEARSKLELESRAARLRPQVEDQPVGQHIILVNSPIRFLHRSLKRSAVNIGSWWQAYFSQHHSVPAESHTLRFHGTGNLI